MYISIFMYIQTYLHMNSKTDIFERVGRVGGTRLTRASTASEVIQLEAQTKRENEEEEVSF